MWTVSLSAILPTFLVFIMFVTGWVKGSIREYILTFLCRIYTLTSILHYRRRLSWFYCLYCMSVIWEIKFAGWRANIRFPDRRYNDYLYCKLVFAREFIWMCNITQLFRISFYWDLRAESRQVEFRKLIYVIIMFQSPLLMFMLGCK